MRKICAAVIVPVAALGIGLGACGSVTVHHYHPAPKPAAVQYMPKAPQQPAGTTCYWVYYNNQPQKYVCTSAPVPTPSSAPATATPVVDPYQDNGFFNATTLAQSVANEQAQALQNSNQYNNSSQGSAVVTCNYYQMNAFDCTGTDSAGDVGADDYVTPSSDGTTWSDTGMTWNGPAVAGTLTVNPVSGWSAS